MEFSEQVLIVHTGRFREADLWVRFLSPTRGLLTAFAFGGCRSRKRFCGCLDLFNRALLRVKSTRGGQYLSIQEGTLLRGPDRLRRDWPRFGAAVNCLKFLEALGCGPEGAAATHRLVEDVLELLEGDAPVPDMLPVLFRLRLAAEQGYAPRIDACGTCGADLTHVPGAAFLVQEGAAQCDACAPLPGPRVRVEREALDVLRFVQENSPLLWPGVLPAAPGQAAAVAGGEHSPPTPHGGLPGPDGPGVPDFFEPGMPTPDSHGPNGRDQDLPPPDMTPRADSTRNGFAGGASPRFLDGRFLGSLSGLAFGDGGHGSLDDCLCRLPDSALAQDAATQAGPDRADAPEPEPSAPSDAPRPLWNGSSVFESDPFGPVRGSEDHGSEDWADEGVAQPREISGVNRSAVPSMSLRPAMPAVPTGPTGQAGQAGQSNRAGRAGQSSPDARGPADRFLAADTPGMVVTPDAKGMAAVRRQCTRAVDGFIQFHIGLAWDNGRFRRL